MYIYYNTLKYGLILLTTVCATQCEFSLCSIYKCAVLYQIVSNTSKVNGFIKFRNKKTVSSFPYNSTLRLIVKPLGYFEMTYNLRIWHKLGSLGTSVAINPKIMNFKSCYKLLRDKLTFGGNFIQCAAQATRK